MHAFPRDVELTDKREKEYMLRVVNIENILKDNLRQNGRKKNAEKRSSDNLNGKKPKRNEREEDAKTTKSIEVRKNTS